MEVLWVVLMTCVLASVAEDIDVVAGVEEEDGEAGGVDDGAVLLGTEKVFHKVLLLGGDRHEEVDVGSMVLEDGAVGIGAGAGDGAFLVGNGESLVEFAQKLEVGATFVAESLVLVVVVHGYEGAAAEAGEIAGPHKLLLAGFAVVHAESHPWGLAVAEWLLHREVGHLAGGEVGEQPTLVEW